MKIIIEPTTLKEKYEHIDGLLLSLKDFSVQSGKYYTLEEIKKIKENNPVEIFISMNKNFMNEEIPAVKDMLQEIDKLNVTGILFYDVALLQLKKELDIKTDLVWASTYMVNNTKTCNYYHAKGVKYALLGKEITLEEMKEIIKDSSITSMVEVVGLPSVAFSKRKLISNFYSDLEKETKPSIDVVEKVSGETYEVTEDKNGTNFYLKKIVNGTVVIKDLFEVNTPYIILKEFGIDSNEFYELVKDTKEYIEGNCQNNEYIEKYKKLGDFTNFFFKKTIYKVKKNG